MTAGTYIPDPPRFDALIKTVLGREPNVAPPVRSRTLREWTGVVRSVVDEVRNNWKGMPEEEREWLRLWAIDELPKSGPLERFALRIVSGIIYATHPGDVSDFLSEGKILREAVLEQVTAGVWQYTLDDGDFARDYSAGVAEIMAGKGVRINTDGL